MLKRLSKGATIGIINPAFKNPKEVFQKYEEMISYIQRCGYKIKYGKSFTDEEGYLAGSDINRANDLMDMFKNQSVQAIFCMRGGYGCSRMVDKIDFEVVKNNPKIFCGFSDITVLLNNIFVKAGFPTVHGLVSLYLKDSLDDFSKKDFWDMMTKNQKGRVLKNPNDSSKTLVPGCATGVLVGGNLSLICTLIGTPYEIDFTDKIVFIEEVEEEPYQIDRYLSSLRLQGMLKKAKGFVLGYFTDCLPSETRKNTQKYTDIINDYFKDLNKPVFYDFACGHSFPFINLPIGTLVTMDADKKMITIEEEIYEHEAN